MRRADSLEKILMLGKIEGRGSSQQKMIWCDSITDSVDRNLSKLQQTVEDKGAWHPRVCGFTNSWTQFSDWTTAKLLGKHTLERRPMVWLENCLYCRRDYISDSWIHSITEVWTRDGLLNKDLWRMLCLKVWISVMFMGNPQRFLRMSYTINMTSLEWNE